MVESFLRCRWSRLIWALIVASGLAVFPSLATAQETAISVPPGQPVTPEQMKAIQEAQERARAQAQGGQPQPNQEPKKEEEKKKEGEGDKEKKDEGTDSVKRPEKPPRVPDPRELEVALDKNGKVPPFSFIGQPWPDVMQWLANLSKSSLDWQELPNDYVNLMTDRAKTVDEVRDEINRLLHARGYMSVHVGKGLSVFKLDKLDPSMVKRVSEEELYDLLPYDFVKVSFELPTGMDVAKAKDDVKQVLSPNAKVFPLVTTKRLLLIDAVANLRLVSALLNEERSVQDGRVVPKEFVLKYRRPEEVIDILYVVLGMDPKSRPTQMDLQLQQQKLQLMQQMQQKGTDVSKMLKPEGPPVYLAYNKQRNSVLANAPPEQMKIIEQTIAYLDSPFGETGEASLAAPAGGERTMEKYPLATLDPQNFLSTLEDIGGLDPRAELKVDSSSRVLFALASAADHKKIARLIDQFDGEGRRFYVIQLRRQPADLVAASIKELMVGEKKDDQQNRYPYYYWDYGRRQSEQKTDPHEGFRVLADVEANRLMLRANAEEMAEVRKLLAEMGEVPPEQTAQRPIRIIEPGGDVATPELLERLRRIWSATGENELIFNVPAQLPTKRQPKKEEGDEKDQPKKDEADASKADRTTRLGPPAGVSVQFAQLEVQGDEGGAADAAAAEKQSDEPNDRAEPPAGRPPVTVTVTEDGRILLSSKDAAALDRLEELVEQLSPPKRRFKVFPLKHIPVLDMFYDLQDFFRDELEGKQEGNSFYDWYFGYRRGGNQDQGPTGLGKRRKLMITYDVPSKSILVANASPSQLAEIGQLIEEFDKPARQDSVEIRQTAPIKIRYSKASVIAAAVKEVYRDLLSARDKEFDRGGDQRQQGRSRERVTIIDYGGGSGSDSGDRGAPVKVGFEGALSIGVDDISNMLVVSAQKGIFDDVVRMIQELDEEAAPKETVYVHRVGGTVKAADLQKAIDKALSKTWPGGRPEQATTGQGGGQQGQQRGEGDRRRGDRRRGAGENNND